MIDVEKAFILISCEVGAESDLAGVLTPIEEIKNILVAYGDYDIVAEVQTETPEQMDLFIASKIRRLEKVRSAITLRVASSSP